MSIALAEALSESGRQVVLVEGDPLFGDLGLRLDIDLPRELPDDDLAVAQMLRPHRPYLDVWLPPQASEIAVDVDPQRALGFVSALQSMADHVVVDAPPLRSNQFELLPAADNVLLVAGGALSDLKNAMVAAHLLREIGVGPGLLRLVVNGLEKWRGPNRRDISRTVGVDAVTLLPDRHSDRWAPAVLDLVELIA